MTKPPSPTSRPGQRKGFADSTLPLAHESDSDTAWDQFHDLEARQNARFADTQPGDSSTLPPAALARLKAPPRNIGVTMDEVLVEARRNNRVCPQPVFWYQLYDLLPDAPRRPAPPPEGQTWRTSSSLARRMMLRDHLEFAERSGVLDAVMAMLRKLREEDWVHME
jgi:hypothetical protein